MKKIFFSSFILTLFLGAPGQRAYGTEFPSQGPCITQHLREAIVINRQRRPLYSQLSRGASEEITDNLIQMEQQMMLGSHILDRLARKYHREGIPVFCQDMMPMSLTPPFQASYEQGAPDLRDYLTPNSRVITRDLRQGLRQGGFEGLEYQAMKWYDVFAGEPRFNCLIRHFLESTVRSARLAVKYNQYAQENKLRSPDRLMLRYLQLSFFTFSQAIALDRKAAPLQAQGLPILCRDVPHIPFDSDWPYN